MLVKQPKYRKSLNSNQIELLKLMYKFRFVSLDLLAKYLNKDRSTIYERLYVLERQGYIAKRYDSSYRLRGKPASYTLSKAGIKYLMTLENSDHTYLRASYKNRTATEEVIDQRLLVFITALSLKSRMSKDYQIYTRYELTKEAFVNPLPDLYFYTNTDSPDYLVDIIEAWTPSWQLRRRIRQHEELVEKSEEDYPDVLFIAGNKSTEKRLFKLTYEKYNEFKFYVTQAELLTRKEADIWIDPEESDYEEVERVSLPPI